MANSVLELIEDINRQGTTVVMVTHDKELAARARRNVQIVDGVASDVTDERRREAGQTAAQET
jgi:putative ABC transport system ATP-binding protein